MHPLLLPPRLCRPQVRATYHKYMHPKEALISHGILHPDIVRMKDVASLSRRGGGTSRTARKAGGTDASDNRRKSNLTDAICPSGDDAPLSSGACGGLTFVYPFGATMTVQSPAHPVLSSGPISYPLNRPVAGVWERPSNASPGGDPGGSGGRGRGVNGRAGARGVGRGVREARPEDHEGTFISIELLAGNRVKKAVRHLGVAKLWVTELRR